MGCLSARVVVYPQHRRSLQTMAAPTGSSLYETSVPERIPPLQNGDRLTRPEFERRYDAMPHLKKAELIEGVVYVPSPVRYEGHGRQHAVLNAWLGVYAASTPG